MSSHALSAPYEAGVTDNVVPERLSIMEVAMSDFADIPAAGDAFLDEDEEL